MKILVVISTLRYGGAQRVVSLLTREWAKDHEVTLAVFDTSTQGFPYAGAVVDLRSAAADHVWAKACKLIARSVRLTRLFRLERPDRIISFMESANFPSIVAALLTRSLVRLRVSVRVDPMRLSALQRMLIRWWYRCPERVIAVSSGVRVSLIRMGLPAGTVSAIPNPVVIPHAPTGSPSSPLESQFILGVGRLHPQKGFDRLIRAFSEVPRRDVHLAILGDGAEHERLATLARELGIDERVHLKGAVGDVVSWYRHAECFVLSSRYEGWPNVIGEAMANGCPVVSYDCRYGPSEIIEHDRSGLLVADGDIDGLAAAISRVVGDDALRTRLAAEGRSRVRLFMLENIAPRWLAADVA
jgi:GalNAc-alpha-(1->4)-GalNAc-alpha-(1->3)-diNAcBac-PP-undecaprenol alpha-1,4-N-acetyl-D-galactosaminyltransferase